MPTSFEAIYLGVLPTIDGREGNQIVSQSAVNQWLGTYGGPADKLGTEENIVDFEPVSFSGGNGGSYDLDNTDSNDSFSIDGGAAQTHDATMLFQATITYGDGTTANITAVVSQDTNGNTYWMPETSENGDHDKIEDAGNHGGIQSLSLNAPIYAFGNPGQGYSLTANRADTNFMPCFAAGTLIKTSRGRVPVEQLKAGDLVKTLDDGFQPVRWVGRKTVAARGAVAPIVFEKNTIGNDRRLTLSPQHRVLLREGLAEVLFAAPDVLVAAKDLVNGETIRQVEGGEVTYVHIMFDKHQLVTSNGALTESFYPGELSLNAIGDEARAELLSLFPELKESAEAYAPAVRHTLKAHEAALVAS